MQRRRPGRDCLCAHMKRQLVLSQEEQREHSDRSALHTRGGQCSTVAHGRLRCCGARQLALRGEGHVHPHPVRTSDARVAARATHALHMFIARGAGRL
jgi:hypothetical protein